MKREFAAGALLLLLVLGAWLNSRRMDQLVWQIDRCLDSSEAAAEQGTFEQALAALENGRRLWEASEGVTGVFLGHQELDAVQDAFFQLEQLLRRGDRAAAPAGYTRLRRCLEEIAALERLSPEAVL